ncbi:signal recognition particle protein Srp19, partial [Candidatus Woesearchaeota archaeon]|nr:signal recognition particle protein Srp19 [Candidatus Woesearchaeota archaeon]
LKIYKNNEKDLSKYDLLLVDTAGRDALSKDLIQEIENLNEYIKPDESILVISADMGQAAKNQAETFYKSAKITGVMVTKLDGTAKGGGALTACAETKAPIKFIGTGEKVDDIETFNPQGFVSRLLGMGDIEALLEKTTGAITEDQAKDMSKKLLKGEFNFVDLYEQLQAMKKLGPIQKVMELIPGFSSVKLPKEMLDVQESKLEKWKYILDSMNKKELEDPALLSAKRIDRIAKGSGCSVSEVRDLIKQYNQTKKLMKSLKGKSPEKLLKRFQGHMQV